MTKQEKSLIIRETLWNGNDSEMVLDSYKSVFDTQWNQQCQDLYTQLLNDPNVDVVCKRFHEQPDNDIDNLIEEYEDFIIEELGY